MRQQNQNSCKPARFFPLTLSIVILTLLLGTWFGTTTSSSATPAMAPPAEGFNLLAWLMPWIAVAIGLFAITWFVKRYHPKRAAESAPEVDEEMLARYRDRIDKDLAKLE